MKYIKTFEEFVNEKKYIWEQIKALNEANLTIQSLLRKSKKHVVVLSDTKYIYAYNGIAYQYNFAPHVKSDDDKKQAFKSMISHLKKSSSIDKAISNELSQGYVNIIPVQRLKGELK